MSRFFWRAPPALSNCPNRPLTVLWSCRSNVIASMLASLPKVRTWHADAAADIDDVDSGRRVVTLGPVFEDVLTAARTGAPWAIGRLYEEYQPALLRYMRARAGQEGEDLTS